MTVAVRLGVTSDAPRVAEVITRAYAKYADRMDRVPAPVTRDHGVALRDGAMWVIGDPILGVISLADDGDALLIGNVAVDPDAQGRGYGRLLMQFAETEALHRGYGRSRLYTNAVMTENIALYRRAGYVEVDRRVEGGFDRVFMEKAIR